MKDTHSGDDRMLAMVYKQREKIEAVFKEFDEDGSGTVSDEEFAMALELLGVDVSVPARLICRACIALVLQRSSSGRPSQQTIR